MIVGPPSWNSVKHLDGLKLPEQDRNLIVTVHYYTPMEFTHQGASWADHRDKTGVEWRGTPAESAAIATDFQRVQQWARNNNRPIFLGEFGAYDKGPMDSRVRYTAAVARTAEKLGWSWAYWQFDSDFILYDIDNDRWVQPIHDALIPKEPSAVARPPARGPKGAACSPFPWGREGRSLTADGQLLQTPALRLPPSR